MKTLKDNVSIITGGNRGTGNATEMVLNENGAQKNWDCMKLLMLK